MMELLAPAGNMEKLKTAFYFGADACYLGGKKFGLRAFSGNFDENELKEAVDYAHARSKKIYVTLNIVAHNPDFEGLKEYIEYLDSIKVDGVIVSDIGIMQFVKDNAPNLPIHVSTQANVTNKHTAKFYENFGVTRLVLARELSINEIKEIKEHVQNVEIECFVHGAMCISYSGRCLLSNYLSSRDSNRGACIQACRFEYSITEKTRKGEHFDIQEDDRGTYILNSKDLNMIEHLREIDEAGITSLKVEGRMKSPYYVATVINAYRRAIDLYYQDKTKECPKNLVQELEKTSHRRYTTGFYFGAKDKEYIEDSMPIQSSEFMAMVLEDSKDGYTLIEQRNRFKVGESLDVLSPTDAFGATINITHMKGEDGVDILDASKVQQKIYLFTGDVELHKGDILRKDI